MTNKHVVRAAIAGVCAAVLALSGCGASNNTANGTANGQSTGTTGGTLNILLSSTEMDLDPAKSQGLPITTNGNIFRRLTAWKITQGGETKVVPDLATTTGEPSDDGKTWTYTLKDGIKFDDGTPITSKDIKYGLERSFADPLTGGLSYHKTLLVGAQDYHGPFDGKHLDSIETPDDKTIVFHLNAPFGDWPWVASLAAFTPVPEGKGPASGYGKTPVASGPYKVESNEAGKQAVYVRNKYWDKKTDPVRTAGPDKIVFKMSQDTSVAAQSIMQGTGEGKNSFLSGFVPPAQLAQAQANPAYQKLLATSGDGALEYLAINTKRVTDLKVRQAIEYAVDKKAYQTASGGEIAGNFATTLITPGIAGREKYDLYKADSTGDVDKAKQLLKEAGQTSPKLKLIATSDQAETASSIQTSLKRAGITVDIQTLNDDVFSDAETNNEGDYDLVIGGWQPDFPSPYANISPLFDSSQIGNGNYNLARYSNPEVDALIKKATETIDQSEAGKIWAETDKKIMADAPVVPLIYSKNTFIHGSNVTNFVIGNFPAYPDYNQVTLASAN
ncbi:ABC transporter substrate-binding protein [Bifidobacterium sp. UTCIF-37]|uniref:ABC transporter substrate-binding protein n=1 Tax=unclassified Bifidobacterium TaxID=2608897 RepID=UPI001128C4E3|nr:MULTISPECIES: ABC transporter substrate-binding protein [unclassified Bifidobacterium]TPF85832.1 ABC transporter substrate-binding protein [Bifidobacterium sp. UTCIF-37]TPF87845.1 ABC transporter substrate-binding protein [Bifidobacterium sp. UTCIF-38]